MKYCRLMTTSIAAAITIAALLASSTASAWCWWNCNYTRTQYPIVLAHGFLGFDNLAGIMDYWYGIVDKLEDGGATVYVTEVSPINSSVNRGEQLIAQLEEIRAIEGDPNLKFNLIGHSQGGLDIRYIAGVRPDLVASLTTIATPHVGVDLFDILGGGDAIPPDILSFFGSLIGDLWMLLGGGDNPDDAMAARSSRLPNTAWTAAPHPWDSNRIQSWPLALLPSQPSSVPRHRALRDRRARLAGERRPTCPRRFRWTGAAPRACAA
jgi:triacylglycerol lipase